MTATRGGAPEPTDSQGLEGTGPSTDESASLTPVYDMGDAWHRYKATPVPPVPDSGYWASISERLLCHPKFTGHVRRRGAPVDVWCMLYVTLMAGRHHKPYGIVDPCAIAAALQVSDRTVRRGMENLEEVKAITERRRVGKGGNLVFVRLDAKQFGVTR